MHEKEEAIRGHQIKPFPNQRGEHFELHIATVCLPFENAQFDCTHITRLEPLPGKANDPSALAGARKPGAAGFAAAPSPTSLEPYVNSPRFGGSASLGAALDAATLCGLSQRPAGALAMERLARRLRVTDELDEARYP